MIRKQMSSYQYASSNYDRPKEQLDQVWKNRVQEWREKGAVERAENPTRISKARSLGYKAKRGFIIVRSRVGKGNSKRERPSGGRRPKRYGQSRFHPKKSKKLIAEERASRHFENLEVLNSYWVLEDGNYKWFEIIMVDPDEPTIEQDDDINWICDERDRVERGKTPEARKNRGLLNKGTGAEKVRPSQETHDNKGK